MDFPKVLTFLILLLFTAILLPYMNTAIENISPLETLKTVFVAMPYVFIASFIFATIYYLFEGGKQ